MGGLRAGEPGNSKVNSKAQHGKKKHKVSNVKKVSGSVVQKTQEKVKPAAVANSNWLALKSKIQQKDQRHKGGKTLEKKHDLDVKAQKQRAKQEKQAKRMKARTAEQDERAARCSIVDYDGNVLYDKHVRPVEKVTDFRTHVSGIKSSSLRHAIPFAQCLKEVGKQLQDKIVVGHALKNDFQALMFTPPKHLIRDTPTTDRICKLYPKSLKNLTEEILGKHIQTGQHDSVEDARATLELYKKEQFAWEKYLRTNKSSSSLVGVAPALPVKETEDDAPKPLSAAAKAHLDSDDEEISTGRGTMAVPDSKELAIMEYGE
ncbi:Exonuclease, RNase T/DNA polymerase III [Phytophthora cactorum]|nr:Exonuclease, RNase T/DNA polymerase III [Phytophthora cactorum]